MKKIKFSLIAISFLSFFSCTNESKSTSDQTESSPSSKKESISENPLKDVYWGDTHNHTGNSFDVFLFGTPNSTPEIAYRFAKGEEVESPTTGQP